MDRGTLSQRNAGYQWGYNNMKRWFVLMGSTALLAMLSMALFLFSASTNANPKYGDDCIVWNRPQLAFSLKPGDSTTTIVTFTAHEKIDEQVTVFVTNGLKDIVSVLPTSFGPLQRGQTATLTVVLKLGVLAQPSTATGTIQFYASRGKLRKPEQVGRPISIAVTTLCPCLPPDPGEAGRATLEGIDSDHDGVRDDVQRYIAVTYVSSATSRAAITQFDRAIEAALRGPATKENSLAAAHLSDRALECGWNLYGRQFNTMRKALEAELLNTNLRLHAYEQYDLQLGGEVFAATPVSQRQETCAFNIAAMPN